jgi:hypothetical protein
MQIKILSYHLPDNPREAIDLQRQVFERCGLAIEQKELPLPWPQSLNAVDDWIVAETQKDPKCGLILCDTDVIPLHRRAVQDVYFPAIEAGALIGFACRPIPEIYGFSHPYASAAMLGFSAKTYRKLDSPSIRENELPDTVKWDVAGNFTNHAREFDVPVILLPPTSFDPPAKWMLYGTELEWGLNCIFAGIFFHALKFRFHPERFIAKAKEVLEKL